MGKNEEVVTLALDMLARKWCDDENLEPLALISACLGQAWLHQGHDLDRVRAMLKNALAYDLCNCRILDLLRKIDARFSSKAYLFRLLVDVEGNFGGVCPKGYVSIFDVIAEDVDEAIGFVIRHEKNDDIRDIHVIEKTQGDRIRDEACGVYRRTSRIFCRE